MKFTKEQTGSVGLFLSFLWWFSWVEPTLKTSAFLPKPSCLWTFSKHNTWQTSSFTSSSSSPPPPTTHRLQVLVSSSSSSNSDNNNVDDYDAWVEALDPSVFDGAVFTEDDPTSSTKKNNDDFNPRGGGGGGSGRWQNNSNGGTRTKRGAPSAATAAGAIGHDYQRDYNVDNSNVDEGAVHALISERLQARKTGQFEVADAIRDQLLQEHGVQIKDKERLWRTGCSTSGSGQRWGGNNSNQRGGRGGGGGRGRDGGGRGRGYNVDGDGNGDVFDDRRGGRRDRGGRRQQNFGPNGHDYCLSSDAGPNQSALSEQDIHDMLAERLQCKLARNFRVADAIQNELYQNGVFVHDGMKEWRADGIGFGDAGRGGSNGTGKPGREAGSRADRMVGPYVMSEYSQSLLLTINDIDDHGDDDDDDDDDDDANRDEGALEAAEELKMRIQEMVDQRLDARMDQDYNVADAIREELRRDYNVEVDDRKREWSVGGVFDKPPGPHEMSKFSEPLESLITVELGDEVDADAVKALRDNIESLIQERDEAKAVRDYNVADAIREDLRDMYNIEIRDREREWSIGGQFEPPPEPYKMSPFSQEPTTITRDEVDDMLQDRDAARAERAYAVADDIKFLLLEDHNIVIDDKLKQWAVHGYFGNDNDKDDRGSRGGNERPSTFTRRGGGSLTDEDIESVEQLLAERTDCKRDRDFAAADRIRDRLMSEYQIRVDDRTMEWHVVTNEYTHTPSNHNLDDDALSYIREQVNQRAVAKLEKDYELADDIRDALMDQFAVNIDDRMKEWTITSNRSFQTADASISAPDSNNTYESESKKDNFFDELESEMMESDPNDNSEMVAVNEERNSDGEEAISLDGLTVAELKERLRAKGLPVSGRKAELIERLHQ